MLLRSFTLSVVLTFATTTSATTLTFDEITPGTQIGTRYEAQGFVLEGRPSSSTFLNQFYTPAQASAQWTGTPGLVFGAVSGGVSLTAGSGVLFNATSIDLSRGDSNKGLIPVDFAGEKQDGTRVFATYWFQDTVAGRNQTFVFGDTFTNLKSLRWSQGAEWHQFDNIVAAEVEAVPEPTSIALMGLAMAGLAVSRRRKS